MGPNVYDKKNDTIKFFSPIIFARLETIFNLSIRLNKSCQGLSLYLDLC